MKFIILVSTFLAALAHGQEALASKDREADLYKTAHTAASVVDINGSYEGQRQFQGIAVDKSCPACNLHGGINLTDENGVPVTAGDGSAVKTGGEGNGTIGQ